jgi:hypothetical protein
MIISLVIWTKKSCCRDRSKIFKKNCGDKLVLDTVNERNFMYFVAGTKCRDSTVVKYIRLCKNWTRRGGGILIKLIMSTEL